MNKKGFTLIELLAVIIIIAIIGLIAIPSVSNIIESSRKNSYVDIVNAYVEKARQEITSRNIVIKKDGSTYYIPIDMLDTENDLTTSPYGEWATIDSNIRYLAYEDDRVLTCSGVAPKVVNADASYPSYMIYNTRLAEYDDEGKTHTKISQGCVPAGSIHEAYVVVTYNKIRKKYDYFWTSRDVTGHTIGLESVDTITTDDIVIKELPIMSTNTTTKQAIASNNPSKKVSFDYDEITARSSYANSKINLYYGDIDLTGGSAALQLTSEEAHKCFEYVVSDDGKSITIVNYIKSCGPEVEIPSEIDGIPVTKIADYAFSGKGLTKVIIHDGVTSIGSHAFYNNSISELYLPNTKVTIGGNAFRGNHLTEINLSANTTIGGGSFSNNWIPKEKAFIYKLDSNGKTDYSQLLGYAGTEKDIVIPDFAGPDLVPLKTIAGSAFESMSIKSVVIPDTVESIGSWAFAGNKLTQIVWPSHLKTIGSVAFQSNQLKSLSDLPSGLTSIGERAFNNNSVETGKGEFVYARTASGIDYSKIVSYAGAEKNIFIPNVAGPDNTSLKTIGNWAFYGCKITGIQNIPSTVNSISANSFTANSVPNGNPHAFIYKRKNDGSIDYSTLVSYAGATRANLTIPGVAGPDSTTLTTIGGSAFAWNGLSGTLTIPEGVKTIGGSAFRYCSISTVKLPTTMESLGSQSFGKTGIPHNYQKNLTKFIYSGTRELDFASAVGASGVNGKFTGETGGSFVFEPTNQTITVSSS